MNWNWIYEADEDGTLQESKALKKRWLIEAKRCFPIGTPVRVTDSDLPEYVGATGFVVDHDPEFVGGYPLISVAFCPELSSAPEDGSAEHDGFYDDELEVLTKEIKPGKLSKAQEEDVAMFKRKNGWTPVLDVDGNIAVCFANDNVVIEDEETAYYRSGRAKV